MRSINQFSLVTSQAIELKESFKGARKLIFHSSRWYIQRIQNPQNSENLIS